MSKKQLIGLAAYNSTEKINNANWSNKLIEPVTINEGDLISVKASFIDTRNDISGNVVIPEDIDISLDYMFYYVNRGGSGLKSGITSGDNRYDPLFPNRQVTCLEFVENRGAVNLPPDLIPPNTKTQVLPGVQEHNPGNIQSIPVSWSSTGTSTALPITNDTTATGKITQNLSPLVESIHHCYSSRTIAKGQGLSLTFENTSISVYDMKIGNLYEIAVPGGVDWNSISGGSLIMPSSTGAIFKCIALPEQPSGILLDEATVGQTYTIKSLGNPWNWSYTDATTGLTYSGSYDTPWEYKGAPNPEVGRSITVDDTSSIESSISSDITNLPSFLAQYRTKGYDLSTIGAAAPVYSEEFPIYNQQTNEWAAAISVGVWFNFVGNITQKFSDGTNIPYEKIFGSLPSNYTIGEGSGLVASADISTPIGSAYIFTEADPYFLKLQQLMMVRVINAGDFDWTTLGGPPANTPTPFTFEVAYSPPPNASPTGIQFFVIPTDQIQIVTTQSSYELISSKKSIPESTVYNSTFLVEAVGTGTLRPPLDTATVYPQGNTAADHALFNDTERFTNTIDYNSADGMPYLLTYCSPTNPVDGSKTYNPDSMDPGDCVPFIKRWTMRLKAGSYEPAYLAQTITRAMSTQKEKINEPKTIDGGNNFKYMATPISGIASQMYDRTVNPEPAGSNQQTSVPFNGGGFNIWAITTLDPLSCVVGGQWPYRVANLSQGPFPYTSGTAGTPQQGPYLPNTDVTTYQPNLFYNPKNPQILPTGDVIPAKLPVNPAYSGQDFDNPNLGYKDDQAFIYRPNAYVTQTPESQASTSIPNDTPISNIQNAVVVPHLMYNDANLDNFNGIKPFGKTFDNNIRSIPMMYRPFISDTSSNYFNTVQFQNNVPVGNDYAIIPIISNSIYGQSKVGAVKDYLSGENYGYFSTYSYNSALDVSTPLVGAPEMNLSFNVENTNLFSFENCHTSIYVKPDEQATSVQSSTALLPTTINIFNETPATSTSGITATFSVPILPGNTQGYNVYLPTLKPFNVQINNLTYADDPSNDWTAMFTPGFTPYSNEFSAFLQISGSILGGVSPDNDLTIWLNIDGNGNATTRVFSGTPAVQTNKTIRPLKAVQQLNAQSGIIFNDMSAKTLSGKAYPFWESLGFDVKSLCKKYDPANPNAPFMKLQEFFDCTTRDFSGTANNFDPTVLTAGSNEQSYISYIDSLSLLGWYTDTTFFSTDKPSVYPGIPEGQPNAAGAAYQLADGFTFQNKIIYNAATSSLSISGNIPYVDLTDGGHYLISLDAYKGSLITDNEVIGVKTIISSYYKATNSFVINSEPDSFIYEHIGNPLLLSTIKVRIIDPITNKEVQNLGGNSSLYLEITRSLTKNNSVTAQISNTE